MKVLVFPKVNIKEETTIILGCFESIHNGHLNLINQAKKLYKPIVMMIIKDPSVVNKNFNKMYISLEQRLEQIASLGISYAIVVDLSLHIKNMDGNIFMEKLLKITKASNIIVGKDFSYGKDAKCSTSDLEKFDIKIFIKKIAKYKNKKISTSIIKELVELGEVEMIKKITPFPLRQEAILNNNFSLKWKFDQLRLHPGIYSCFAIIGDYKYISTVHIDLKKNPHIIIFGLKKKYIGKIIIEYNTLIRKIFKSQLDKMVNEDHKKVEDSIKILYNN